MAAEVHRVFIDYPELRPHFLDESPEPPSAVEEVRLTVVTEMLADALQVGRETAGRLAASQRYVELWGDCIDTTRASSSRLRAFSTNPGPWPTLTTRVATYDATPSPSPLPRHHVMGKIARLDVDAVREGRIPMSVLALPLRFDWAVGVRRAP